MKPTLPLKPDTSEPTQSHFVESPVVVTVPTKHESFLQLYGKKDICPSMTVLKIQQLDSGFMTYLNKNGKVVKSAVLTIDDLHKIVDEAFTSTEKKDGP